MTIPAAKPTWATRPKRSTPTTSAEDPTDALIRRQSEPEDSTAASKGASKHISLNMNSDLHKRLKHFCVKHDTNVSELLSDLAEKFLESQTN